MRGQVAARTNIRPPEHVEAVLRGVMTDRVCLCGCGKPLRKNNRTGWRAEHNAARYRAGERPFRDQSKNPEDKMATWKPCTGCGKGKLRSDNKTGLCKTCKRSCSARGETEGRRPDAIPARATIPLDVVALPPLPEYSVERLVELQHQVVAELRARMSRARSEANAIEKALEDVGAA